MPSPFQNILVTGGCGFIGSNLVRHMREVWPESLVVNLDALTYAGNPENLHDLEGAAGYQLIRGRVEDPELVLDVLRRHRIQAVVHLAAESHVDRSILGPQVFVTTNVLGAQVLLDASLRAGVRRLLYVSTDEVYGPAPEGTDFPETAPFVPSSPYAATKAAADLLALAYHRTYGMEVVVTRCTNNYGPYQFPEKFIPLCITNALEGEPIPIYGDGLQVRDWIHVRDHCRALCAVLQGGRPGQAYNIAGACPRRNLEVVSQVLSFLGRGQELVRHVQDRPGHDRRYAISTARIAGELGWTPSWDFGSGLKETIRWYADNRSWVQRVRDGSYRLYYKEQYGSRLGEEAEDSKLDPDGKRALDPPGGETSE